MFGDFYKLPSTNLNHTGNPSTATLYCKLTGRFDCGEIMVAFTNYTQLITQAIPIASFKLHFLIQEKSDFPGYLTFAQEDEVNSSSAK
jgi:hypothetical protein